MDATRNYRSFENSLPDFYDANPMNIDLQGQSQSDYMTDDLQTNSLFLSVTPSNATASTPSLGVSYSDYENLGVRPKQNQHRNEDVSTSFQTNQWQLQSSYGLTHQFLQQTSAFNMVGLQASLSSSLDSNLTFGLSVDGNQYIRNSNPSLCIDAPPFSNGKKNNSLRDKALVSPYINFNDVPYNHVSLFPNHNSNQSLPDETNFFPNYNFHRGFSAEPMHLSHCGQSSSSSIIPERADLHQYDQTTLGALNRSAGSSCKNSLISEAFSPSQIENVNKKLPEFENHISPSTISTGFHALNQLEYSSQGALSQQDRVQNNQANWISEACGPVNPLQQLENSTLPGTEKPPQKKRNKLSKSEYNKLTKEEKAERKRYLNNEHSKKHNERKKKEEETLQQTVEMLTDFNNALRKQRQQTTKECQILSKALEKGIKH